MTHEAVVLQLRYSEDSRKLVAAKGCDGGTHICDNVWKLWARSIVMSTSGKAALRITSIRSNLTDNASTSRVTGSRELYNY